MLLNFLSCLPNIYHYNSEKHSVVICYTQPCVSSKFNLATVFLNQFNDTISVRRYGILLDLLWFLLQPSAKPENRVAVFIKFLFFLGFSILALVAARIFFYTIIDVWRYYLMF